MAELNEQVLRFQATGQGLEELLSLLSARVYAYPRLRGSRSEDDAGEFYLLCYPRLVRTLRRFREQGKPFEWYLQSVLRWQWPTADPAAPGAPGPREAWSPLGAPPSCGRARAEPPDAPPGPANSAWRKWGGAP
jgi:hypothetical protein